MVELVDTSDLNPDGQLAMRVRVSLGGQIKWMYVTSPLGADRMLHYTTTVINVGSNPTASTMRSLKLCS